MTPVTEFLRELPWALPILVAGGVALLAGLFALTRRHVGEASLGFALCAAALAAILSELGQVALALGLLWTAITFAAGVALVAETARVLPGAPRTAPANEQRLLALLIAALLAGAWTVAGLAVDWPLAEPRRLSALAVSFVLGSLGIVGLLTRRHWLSVLLAAQVVVDALVLGAVALPDPAAARIAPPLLVWGWGMGSAGLILVTVALRRGYGPWTEPLTGTRP